jgi:hypothetical protein
MQKKKINICLKHFLIFILGHLVFVTRTIWKERGRRVFQNESMNASALAGLIRAEIELLTLAKGRVIDP